MSNSTEDFYLKLKTKLQETCSWPSEYLFKFIVKSDPEKIADIESLFNKMETIITATPSKKGTYTSLSIHVEMKNPESVIEKYKQVGKTVQDVISL